MATPRTAKFDQTTTVSWADGTAFNGYILLGLVPPTTGGTAWTTLDYNGEFPGLRLPTFTLVPILNGKYNSDLAVFYSGDVTPPGSKYVAWYYDTTRRKIAGPSTLFTVTTNPFTPPALALTTPTSGVTPPTPDE